MRLNDSGFSCAEASTINRKRKKEEINFIIE
jgi:hypothetical protein